MEQYCGYLYFESEKDYDNCVANPIFRGGMIHKANIFPACYHYESSLCSGFCGDWKLCNINDFIDTVNSDINDLNKLLKKISKTS